MESLRYTAEEKWILLFSELRGAQFSVIAYSFLSSYFFLLCLIVHLALPERVLLCESSNIN